MAKKITKNKIINQIANETGLSRYKTGEVLNLFMNLLVIHSLKGEKISISGFGNFEMKEIKNHNTYDFKNKQHSHRKIDVNYIHFKNSKKLRTLIN